jgi:hypothetical protein
MTATWKDDPLTGWTCSAEHHHRPGDEWCFDQEPAEQRPDPPGAVADQPRTTPGFFVTLPNHLRVRITGDLSIGRGTDTVIGLSLLQFKDVSRGHLDVRLDNGSSLRFLPLKSPEAAPVYHYPDMPSSADVTVDLLRQVEPTLVDPDSPRLDDLILDARSGERRLFCLGQSCFLRFEWGDAA